MKRSHASGLRLVASLLVLLAGAALVSIASVRSVGAASAAYYGYCPGGGASAVYYGYCPPSNATPNLTGPGNQASDEGENHTFSLGSFSDPDNGPWQVVVTWGDATADTFSQSSPGSISRPHTYDDNGTYPVTVTVTDSEAASDSATFQVAVANVPPSATFNAPAAVDEGSPFSLSLTGPSDPSNADTAAGFTHAFDCGDGGGYGPFGPAASASCPTTDDGTRAVGGKIRDKDAGTNEYTAAVRVDNVAPTCGPIVAPVAPISVGTPVTATAPFSDPGTADTHTAEMSWGDATSSAATVTEAGGSGTASASHTYTAAGVYTLTLTVADDDGGSGQCMFEFVVVFDASAGFVTGGGWINSPPGAYTADPTLTGKASFGFVSKYHRGASIPSGNTQFQFKAGDLNFHSTSYDWLVIAGAKARFKGSGTINGAGDYRFRITAIDGKAAGDGVDKFRIKIWDKTTGGVIYDNQLGAGDDAEPSTVLGGGSITIHR